MDDINTFFLNMGIDLEIDPDLSEINDILHTSYRSWYVKQEPYVYPDLKDVM